MKCTATIILTATLLSFRVHAQDVKIEIPETYELSNIVLALTEYGRQDEWEVQKKSEYYRNVLAFFEPVKDHPLLDSVNYSRQKWDSYLSFRTDAYVFSFDSQNNLKRDKSFYAIDGKNAFEQHLALVNDFVQKSNFREFYRRNSVFYNDLVARYKEYHFIGETYRFLNRRIGQPKERSNATRFTIVLSPLVLRMNCHRTIDAQTEADFPSATENFLNSITRTSLAQRVVDNHMPFTEIDHGYINPISSKFATAIEKSFATKKWEQESGYTGIDVFNEYITWAVYELFLQEKFPSLADSISLLWQYQNASRGFIAQNLFSKKLKELYDQNKGKKFEAIYEPLLKWCEEMDSIGQPRLVNLKNGYNKVDTKNLALEFSEEMDKTKPIKIQVYEHADGRPTGKKEFITPNQPVWSENGRTLTLALDIRYKNFSIGFNEWGNDRPLYSKRGILLKPWSFFFGEQFD
jgi:hypothetical protein